MDKRINGKSNIVIHICPEGGNILTLANDDGNMKFYLCRECLSTWVTDIKDNTETELRRYFFG